jgi:hypothetical protein
MLSAVWLLLFAGCGPSRPATVAVRGIVTLDGTPVAGGAVMFSPQSGGRPAEGVTDAEGNFTLKTFDPGDGALVGMHNVTVTLKETTGISADPDGLSGEVAPGGIQEKYIVPQRYSVPETSGLIVEVKRGMEPVKLALTSN